jgi:ABC-type phosphate transport system substrate-binding protein
MLTTGECDIMSAIRRTLIVFFVAVAVLSVAGCLGQSDREKAQDKYDTLVHQTNDQIAVVQNVSNQQNLYAMTQPAMKVWLADYRSQTAELQNDVNATGDAGAALKTYLSPGSSDYSTMTTNEQSLQQYLAMYVGDYNMNADGYNSHWGAEFGMVPVL